MGRRSYMTTIWIPTRSKAEAIQIVQKQWDSNAVTPFATEAENGFIGTFPCHGGHVEGFLVAFADAIPQAKIHIEGLPGPFRRNMKVIERAGLTGAEHKPDTPGQRKKAAVYVADEKHQSAKERLAGMGVERKKKAEVITDRIRRI